MDLELNYCYGCMKELEQDETTCSRCGYDNSHRQNEENTLPEGTILEGKYLLGKVLGKGGYGITYLGFDLKLRVCVAVKEYFPAGLGGRVPGSIRVAAFSAKDQEAFEKGRDEFQAEAICLARFDSPGIVHVRDYFLENGTAYIVMDHVVGNSLTAEAAACGGSLPWKRVLDLFQPLIPELEQLHTEHLIHRDIKPDNIKIVKDKNGKERLVLLDFGAARTYISSQITQTYETTLTPGYAPSEQYSRRSRQGPYTDVYGLCATMYAAITGSVPPDAADRWLNKAEIRPFAEFVPDVPEKVEKAILHGLALHSEDRTQTMRELYDELFGSEDEPNVPESAGDADFPTPAENEGQDTESASGERSFIGSVQTASVPAEDFSDDASATDSGTEISSLPEDEPDLHGTDSVDPQKKKPAKKFILAGILVLILAAAVILTFVIPSLEKNAAGGGSGENTNGAVQTAAVHQQTSDSKNRSGSSGSSDAAALPVGSIVTFGTYEQDNDPSNGPEPIEWIVLDVKEADVLLMSRYGLESRAYHTYTTVTWVNSLLRKWLNEEFYETAFNEAEKNLIHEVENRTSDNTGIYREKGEEGAVANTDDKVFLLDSYEFRKYVTETDPLIGQCRASEHARQNGARTDNNGIAGWWLRSQGYLPYMVEIVETNGYQSSSGGIAPDRDGIMVRPVLYVKQ